VTARRRFAAALCAAAILPSAAAAPASPRAGTVKIAFLQGEQVVYVHRPGSTVTAAVRGLLAGPTAAEKAQEITSQLPARTPLRRISVRGGVATIDVGIKFATGSRAESLSARVVQLVLTATRAPNVHSVRLLVKGGTPLGLFPGVLASFPLTAKNVTAPPKSPPPAPASQQPKPPSAATRAVQQRLADLGYMRADEVDGRPGPRTASAVVAFQKWSGLGRDGVVGPATRTALTSATRPTPIRAATGRRIEVLLDRQVTLVIDGGRVTRILDVTTGKPGFETPVGSWRVFRKEARSWSVPYRVWLPWASYFVGGVAFHEYPDVPPVPASHGCVRVPRWDAHWLYTQTPVGTPVSVIGRSR
jgi:peptidoglycan hydrolase-like protein with peptidoglycan-binding domain